MALRSLSLMRDTLNSSSHDIDNPYMWCLGTKQDLAAAAELYGVLCGYTGGKSR